MEKTVGGERAAAKSAAFGKFVVCGGGVGLLSSAVLVAAAGHAPFALVNAVVTVVSTLLATELHHRITFRSAEGGWAGWRVHSKSALTLLGAYLFTTAAVLTLDHAHPHPGALLAQAVYLGASALAGIARFATLRLLVFPTRNPAREAAREAAREGTREAAKPLDRDGVAAAA
ncbi:hypothetical protein ACIQCJ_03840 [Streptomyces sp. NPDC093221]|uniref:hypothetical protein n=1 Tax=Streptomyces sp. NPDC093221 TaxID=3366032 RepID=UPI0038082A66